MFNFCANCIASTPDYWLAPPTSPTRSHIIQPEFGIRSFPDPPFMWGSGHAWLTNLSVCLCVCLLLDKIEDACVSLQLEYLNRKSILISCKHVWISEKRLGCREIAVYSLIDRSPSWSFFAFADVSRKQRNANFCIFEALFLGLCPSS